MIHIQTYIHIQPYTIRIFHDTCFQERYILHNGENMDNVYAVTTLSHFFHRDNVVNSDEIRG